MRNEEEARRQELDRVQFGPYGGLGRDSLSEFTWMGAEELAELGWIITVVSVEQLGGQADNQGRANAAFVGQRVVFLTERHLECTQVNWSLAGS
jgi:hypothetical protein